MASAGGIGAGAGAADDAAVAAAAEKLFESNLRAMDDAALDFNEMLGEVQERYAEVHQRTGSGGVPIVAVLTDVFAASQFSRSFAVQFLNVASQLEAEQLDMLFEDASGNAGLIIPVRYNKGPNSKDPPASIGSPQQEVKLRHFATLTLGIKTELGAQLDRARVKPGDIVILNGVGARAGVAMDPDPHIQGQRKVGSEHWEIYFSVNGIEPTGYDINHLWLAAQNVPSSFFNKNGQAYNEMVPSSRYNRDASYVLSVRPEPHYADAEERDKSLRRMAREFGVVELDQQCLSRDGALKAKANNGKPESARADLTFTVQQWAHGTPWSKASQQYVAVGMTLYEGLLGPVFGITNVATWEALAPIIFTKLSAKFFGFVDTMNSDAAFGGISAVERYNFSLQLFPSCMIADLEGLSRRIGIPVTAEYVAEYIKTPVGRPGGASDTNSRASRLAIVDKLPSSVPVSGAQADAAVVDHLLAIAKEAKPGDPTPEFRAWVNFVPTDPNFDEIEKMSPEDGALLVDAIIRNTPKTAKVCSTPGKLPRISELFGKFRNPTQPPCCVIHALCQDVIPLKSRSSVNAIIMSFISGKHHAGDVPAIEAPSGGAAAAAAAAPSGGTAAAAAAAAAAALTGGDGGSVDAADEIVTDGAAAAPPPHRHALETDQTWEAMERMGKRVADADALALAQKAAPASSAPAADDED